MIFVAKQPQRTPNTTLGYSKRQSQRLPDFFKLINKAIRIRHFVN